MIIRLALALACLAALPAPAAAQTRSNDPLPLLELVSQGGPARLYTLSQREAAGAVANHKMTLQPVRTGYLRARPFDGSQPLHRLRRLADGSRLVTPSESERAALLASQTFAEDGVIGYAHRTAQPGTARLMRYSRTGEWRLAFESEGPALVGAGYRVDGPVGYVDVQSIRAGALYFGMWNAGAQNVITATQRVYGRGGDWWGGVRDYSGGDPAVPVNRWAWPQEDFSYLQPAIGFYDDTQTATVEQHITQASSAGLRYFAFYWYWDAKARREQIAGGLHSFMRAGNRNTLDFALTVCAHAWGDGSLKIPTDQYGQVASTLVDAYLAQPNYLRANDGRRILWLCDTRGLGSGAAADVRAFVGAVRARAREVLADDVLVLAHRDLGLDLADVGADGAYCAAPYKYVQGGSYQRYVSEQRSDLGGGPPIFVRCAMSDFDERPRYPLFFTKPEEAKNLADRTPELFGQAVRNVRDEIAASTRPPVVDNFVLLYAWNEFHEGGMPLEPNVRDGCANLDIVRAGLGLTSGPGCIARPPDAAAAPPAAAPGPALRVGLRVPRTQRVRRRGVTARVRCSAPCRVAATARLKLRLKARLRSKPRTLQTARWTKVRLAAPKRARVRSGKALRRRGGVRVKVTVRAVPLGSGATTKVSRRARISRR